MAVKRMVANIAAEQVGVARRLYGDLLGLRLAMDPGWIVTFEAAGAADQRGDALSRPKFARPITRERTDYLTFGG